MSDWYGSQKFTWLSKIVISGVLDTGPLFTKKDLVLHRYRNPHYKPETVWRLSQVYNGNPYTDKMHLLTHWGRATYICISNLTIIGSDNGLLPGRRQAISWTNAGILLFRTLGTNFSEILSEIYTFSFMKMHLKMLSAKWQPFCSGGDAQDGILVITEHADIQAFYNAVPSPHPMLEIWNHKLP